MKKKSLELNTSNTKFFKLYFDYSPQLICSQSTIKVIGNLKLKRSSPKKVLINIKLI